MLRCLILRTYVNRSVVIPLHCCYCKILLLLSIYSYAASYRPRKAWAQVGITPNSRQLALSCFFVEVLYIFSNQSIDKTHKNAQPVSKIKQQTCGLRFEQFHSRMLCCFKFLFCLRFCFASVVTVMLLFEQNNEHHHLWR